MFAGITRSSLSSRSSWNPGTLSMVLLSLVVATGCRSCGADNKHKAKKKSDQVVKRKTAPSKPVSSIAAEAGPKGALAKLPFKVPTAEDARELAPEVTAARDLILKADKASTEAGRAQLIEFVKTHETDADAHYWIGRSWMAESVAVPAIDEFKLAIQHDAAFIGARQWASVAMQKEKRCADAVEHLNSVMEARPDDLDAVYNRGVCKIAVADWDTALADLTRYCEKNAEPFCSDVAKAQKMQANATGERRVPTDEEKAEFEKKKAAGELPAAREAFRKKVQGQ